MRFEAPEFLIWTAVLAPVVLLFLRRPQRPRLRVSSLALFEASDARPAAAPLPRRLRRLLPFLLAAGTVLLAVGALARLSWSDPEARRDADRAEATEHPAAAVRGASRAASWTQPPGGPDPFTRAAVHAAAPQHGLVVTAIASNEPHADVLTIPGRGSVVFDARGLAPRARAALPDEGLAIEGPLSADTHHPILAGVASARLTLTQTAVPAWRPGTRVLWDGPHGPLLTAREAGGLRIVTMAFSPERSERLAYTASWPILVANALAWVLDASRVAVGEAPPGPAPTHARATVGLPGILLWVVLGLLVLEAWLFHRRGWF